ncbi:exo-alpha-sialidase [Poriferisphaera sp. WC338]|uniref:exo-alpha-sialidase n=1 Tax=Poriferisphaera sp. WC338 TaxID=3425129 RepID=UPI003D8135B3
MKTISNMLKAARLPLIAALCLFGASSLRAQPVQHSVVFERGEAGYDTFRIPALVKAANGDLLAFAEGRRNSASDTGNINIMMKRSTDNGRTWGSLQLVQDYGRHTVGNPVPILDTNTGNLILVTTRNLGQDTQTEITNGTSDGGRTVWVQTSTNNGQSWSSPTEITSQVKDPSWRWFATGPGGGIQLTRGAHAGRILLASPFDGGPNSGERGATAFYSDDGGVTWNMGGQMRDVSGRDFNPSESQLVELTNGNVYVNSRNRATAPDGNHYRASSYLKNSGENFLSGAIDFDQLDPVVEGSVERFTAVDEGDDRNRILLSHPKHETDRREMTLQLSYDETDTWTDGKMLRRGLAGYSDMAKISGNGVSNPMMGMLYENGSSKYYDRISFARFSQSWVESPTLMQFQSTSNTTGGTISAGSTIHDTQGNGINGTLVGNGVTVVTGDTRYRNHGTTAMHFDGQNDYIRVDDTTDHLFDFEADESFTLEILFRTTDHGAGLNDIMPLIAKDVGSNSESYWLRIQDGKVRFFVDDGNETAAAKSSVRVDDDEWHHVAAVRDAATNQLKLYLDHVLIDTKVDDTTGSFANNRDLIIGAFNSSSPGDRRFHGDVQFARISQGALNQDQFLQPIPEPASLSALMLGLFLSRRPYRRSAT